MATYFVKTGGSDSANGLSDANAWATLSKVNAQSFVAGDRIQLRRGDVWREDLTVPTSGTTGNPIVFTHYGSASSPPLINAANLVTSWTDNGSNVWRAAVTTQPQIVMFDGVLGIPSASSVACNSATKWFWASNILYTYGTVNPTSTYTAIEAAIRPTNGEAPFFINGKNHITVDGIAVYHSNAVGIKNYANSAGQAGRTVRYCSVQYSADGGICIFADNFFFSTTTIEYNDVGYANLRAGFDGSGALEGITVMHADGYEIGGNTVHHCVEEGIDSHGQSRNGRIHHNHVHTQIGAIQFRPAIYADGGLNVEVDHNVASGYTNNLCKGYQLNCEISTHTSTNMRYHHNIAYNCQTGFEIANSGGGDGHTSFKVYHNTFYQMAQYGILFNSDVSGKLAGTNEIKNNIFDTSVTNDIVDFSGPNYGIANTTISHNYFKTGNPSETQGSNAVVAASPLFANGASAFFWLQPTSPCINAGTPIAGINDGYNGTAPDIGAYEYPERPRFV